MTTNEQVRESRSVRLHQTEWDIAEAIARLNLSAPLGERVSAGSGLRTALRMAERAIRDSSQGGEFDEIMTRVREQRSQDGTR